MLADGHLQRRHSLRGQLRDGAFKAAVDQSGWKVKQHINQARLINAQKLGQ